jgi:hypothetical protein
MSELHNNLRDGLWVLALIVAAPWGLTMAAMVMAYGRWRRASRRLDPALAPVPAPVTQQELDEARRVERDLEVDYDALDALDVPADRPAPDDVLRRLGVGPGRQRRGGDAR